MRETEVYETFCRFCLAKFERKTLAGSLKATEYHELACPKRAGSLAPAVKAD